MKKGISLPIEMIVIVAIAVLVLVVIAAFFVSSFTIGGAASDTSAFGRGCQMLRNIYCPLSAVSSIAIADYTPTGGLASNLATACSRVHPECGATTAIDDACCRKACGCPA